MRTLHVMSPRRTPSRRRLVNIMGVSLRGRHSRKKGERSERIAQNPSFRGNYRLSEDRNKRPNRGFVGYHQDWEH